MRPLNLVILIVGLATVDGPQGADKSAERLRVMRAMADGITMEQNASGGRPGLERLPEPVYRFDDPARQHSDGTVWLWCRSGRPAALLTLSKDRSPSEGLRWIYELTSVARPDLRHCFGVRPVATSRGGGRHAEVPQGRAPG